MLCKHVMRLKKSEEGGVIILVTFAILVLVAAAGVAFDMSRMQTAKAKLSNCLDTAGLAALSKVAITPSGVSVNDWVVQNVKKYFLADCQSGYLETANVSFNGQNQKNNISVVLSPDYDTLTLDAIVTQNTSLMPIIGVPQVTISAHSVASRTTSGLELSLVLDNTGSMSDVVKAGETASKMDALKCALAGDVVARNSTFCETHGLITFGLLDILFGGGDTRPNLFLSVIAFSDMVNVGATRAPGDTFISNLNSNLTNCVDSRDGTAPSVTDSDLASYMKSLNDVPITLDISDDPPRGSTPFKGLPATSGGHSVNGACPLAFQSITESKSDAEAAIKKMQPNGNTMIQLGFAWGWRALSPNWTGLWGSTPVYQVPNTTTTMPLPLPYNTQGMSKVVVLMTDGVNTVPDYSVLNNAYEDQSFRPATPTQLDKLTYTVCDAMKKRGIIIYTIGFGQTGDVNTDLLKRCASPGPDPHYFLAPSNADLGAAFQQIGNQLSNLLITQ